MEDMTERIQSILKDEESMKQLSELADMLSGGAIGGNGTSAEQP